MTLFYIYYSLVLLIQQMHENIQTFVVPTPIPNKNQQQLSSFVFLINKVNDFFFLFFCSKFKLIQTQQIYNHYMGGQSQNLKKHLVENTNDQHPQNHIDAGDILKSLVYGGLDGGINTLIIVLTGIITDEPAKNIMAFCIAAIVGDGIGMGLGDYLSARAQIQYIKAEQARQLYEVEHLQSEQKKEIIDIYLEKGFTLDDCNRMADLIATNKQAFVNIMMLEQLGLVVVDQKLALKCGVVTLIAFMVFGVLPALPYIIGYGIVGSESQQLAAVLAIGVVQLFSLGYAKAAMIGLNPWKSGLQTLLFGAAITGIGCGLGKLFS